jgi:hypothetical protein
MADYYILVGSYSDDITTLAFDPTSKTLQVVSSLTVGHHPSWIASHNAHPSLVWTGLEQSEGKILALNYDKRGNCKVVSDTSSAGSDPCFLWAEKDELIIANVRWTLSLIKPILYLICSIHRELLAFYPYLQIPHKPWHQPNPSSCTVSGQTNRGNNAPILIQLLSMKSIKNFWCQTWVQTASVDLRKTITDCGN